jgi:hypothetical protein
MHDHEDSAAYSMLNLRDQQPAAPGRIASAAHAPHGSLACPNATCIDSLAAHVREWGIGGSEGLLNASIAYTPAVGK